MRGRRRRRIRAEVALEAELQAEEEQRRRRVLLEKSARETRMIRVAEAEDVDR